MSLFSEKYFLGIEKISRILDKDKIEKVVILIRGIQRKKGRIFFLGVGGSAANCSHAVNDFRKLCNIECYTPVDNISELTARINDDGWNTSYENWLKVSKLQSKDGIFVFSVGGGDISKNISVNIVNALRFAKRKKCKIFGIVGKKNSFTEKIADHTILIPNINNDLITPYAESFQSVIWHYIVSHPQLKINKTKW
jgi:D-sedoheptulose 7-phosphate isomerase